MTHHVVRSWRHLFEPMRLGHKLHDLRLNDRNYKVGDTMLLQEYDVEGGGYTGREVTVQICHITGRDEGHTPCAVSSVVLHRDYVILSIRLV